ncbi:MAG: hypothetical protein ACOC1F_10505, partial [Myxococcota bacterium]
TGVAISVVLAVLAGVGFLRREEPLVVETHFQPQLALSAWTPAAEASGSVPARSAPGAHASAPPKEPPARPPPGRRAPKVPTKAPPASDCVPPYTLDANGHKIWKRHCLR